MVIKCRSSFIAENQITGVDERETKKNAAFLVRPEKNKFANRKIIILLCCNKGIKT
jgi:hypothetical protein